QDFTGAQPDERCHEGQVRAFVRDYPADLVRLPAQHVARGKPLVFLRAEGGGGYHIAVDRVDRPVHAVQLAVHTAAGRVDRPVAGRTVDRPRDHALHLVADREARDPRGTILVEHGRRGLAEEHRPVFAVRVVAVPRENVHLDRLRREELLELERQWSARREADFHDLRKLLRALLRWRHRDRDVAVDLGAAGDREAVIRVEPPPLAGEEAEQQQGASPVLAVLELIEAHGLPGRVSCREVCTTDASVVLWLIVTASLASRYKPR